VEFESGPS